MGFKINDFVSISINYKRDANNQLQFGTTTLLWDKSRQQFDIDYILTGYANSVDDIYSLCETNAEIPSDALNEYKEVIRQFENYVSTYFANGGNFLHVIPVDGLEDAESKIKELMNTEIIITSNFDYSSMLTICNEINNGENNSIDSKLFLTHGLLSIITPEMDNISNFAVMYDNDDSVDSITGKLNYETVSNGLEMAIAGYLSSIDPYKTDSVKDLMFTPFEVGAMTGLPEIPSNADKSTVNFVGEIPSLSSGNSGIYIIGGNGVNDVSIVNQFELLILHNIITDDLFEFLLTKPKYNANSISNAISIISNDLSLFVNNGYIETNATWTAADLTDDDGNVLIKTGDSLPKGYRVFVGEITSESREAGVLPDFYVALADTSGVRYINVSGRAI